jgi:hypothetical protein
MTTRNTPQTLPAGFEDLEIFVDDWALATETERMKKRWSSSMEEIRALYDAMVPRIEAVLDYLDQRDIKAYSEPEQRLMLLALSLAEATSAVETYNEPGVRYGFDSPERYVPTENIKR